MRIIFHNEHFTVEAVLVLYSMDRRTLTEKFRKNSLWVGDFTKDEAAWELIEFLRQHEASAKWLEGVLARTFETGMLRQYYLDHPTTEESKKK